MRAARDPSFFFFSFNVLSPFLLLLHVSSSSLSGIGAVEVRAGGAGREWGGRMGSGCARPQRALVPAPAWAPAGSWLPREVSGLLVGGLEGRLA